MRIASIAITLVAFLMRFCGSNDAPPAAAPPAAVTIGAPAPGVAGQAVVRVPARAMYGGTLVTAGQYDVEVVTKQNGRVVAYVSGANGAALAPPSTLTVKVPGSDGQEHAVALVWNAADARFEGTAAGVTFANGPARVELVANGLAATGVGQVVVTGADGQAVRVGGSGVHVVGAAGQHVQVGATGVHVQGQNGRVVGGGAGTVVTGEDGEQVIMGPGGIQVRGANGVRTSIGAQGVISGDGRVHVGPNGVVVQDNVGATVHVGTDDSE